MLQQLKKAGIKTAVVSNKLHSAVEGLCEDYFNGLIDIPIGVSEEAERKPSPVNVFKAMERIEAEKAYTIYIGDSEVDVQTAENAGLSCIGVTWGFRDEEELKNAGARFIVDAPDEILHIVLKQS